MQTIVSNDFDSYAMWMAYEVSQRSKCLSRNVGAVITQGRHIISTGYNGPTSGYPHPKSCKRKDLGIPSGEKIELCPCSDSELNAIIQAARNGISTRDATIYLFAGILPCTLKCAPAIIGAGIKKVVCLCNIEHQSDPDSVTTTEKFRCAKVDVAEYLGPLRDILLKLENKSFLSRAQPARMEMK